MIIIRKILLLALVLSPGIIEIASAQSFAHPNMYINSNEIQTIKTKLLAGQQPWKTAYDKMMVDANSALAISPVSITYGGPAPPSGDNHDYWAGAVGSGLDKYDYTAAIKVSRSVRDLGLAYAFTGDSKYADKAVQLINTWTVYPSTKMNPKITPNSNFIHYAITFPGMFYGADLIWNYPGWSSSDRDIFKQWALSITNDAKSGQWCQPTLCQNYENWRLVLVSSGAVIAEDTNTLSYAFNRYKELIPHQMDTEGRMLYEINRENSLSYSMYAINAMGQTAEIARHFGVNLYNYRLEDGRGLEKALDYIAPYTANPSKWHYKQIKTYNGENAAIFELAYSFKQKNIYADVITKWKRPMRETRTMGPVTLTHAERDIQILPLPSVTPTVTPTVQPSVTPTVQPSVTPTVQPSVTPTVTPTVQPSVTPTEPVTLPQIKVVCYKIKKQEKEKI